MAKNMAPSVPRKCNQLAATASAHATTTSLPRLHLRMQLQPACRACICVCNYNQLAALVSAHYVISCIQLQPTRYACIYATHRIATGSPLAAHRIASSSPARLPYVYTYVHTYCVLIKPPMPYITSSPLCLLRVFTS